MRKLTGKAVSISLGFYKQAIYDKLYYWHALTNSYGTPSEELNRRLWNDYTERAYAYKNLLREFGFTCDDLEDIANCVNFDFWSTHDA